MTTAARVRQVFLRAFSQENIVLVQALGICPIIAAGISLQRGVALTACTAAALIPSCLLMSLLGKRIPSVVRPPLYTLLAMAMMVGCAWLMTTYISPELYASLYLFLPLMSVNTIFTYRAGGYSIGRHPLLAFTDAIGTSLGFGIVICIVSTLRELAISGTIWGKPMGFEVRLPEAAYPFAAFILLGFMAALLQQIKSRHALTITEEAIGDE